jgi:hypothetical protein
MKCAKQAYWYYTKKPAEHPDHKAHVIKVVGQMRINMKSLIDILTDQNNRHQWDLNVLQAYNGKSELSKKNYMIVEYKNSKGKKFEEITTYEYMTVDKSDYVIETIKVANEEAKRIWVLDRYAGISEPSLVQMYVHIPVSMIHSRGEDCAMQHSEIF